MSKTQKISRFKRLVEWSSRLGALYIIFAIALYFDAKFQGEDIPGVSKRVVILVAALIGYLFVIWPIGVSLKAKIYSLANPHKGDPETEGIAGWIATAILIGITAIFLLFGLDYIGHTAAADRALAEKERERAEGAGQASVLLQNPNPSLVAPLEANVFPTTSAEHRVVVEIKPLPANKNDTDLPPASWIERVGNSFGPFGDFFGGVLNPLLTFGTLIALVITVLMQRVQLKEARSEAKRASAHEQKSSFETTFFNMLTLHAENVRHLSFDPSVISLPDRTELPIWRQVIQLGVGTPKTPSLAHGRAVFAEVLKRTSQCSDRSRPQRDVYQTLQVEHNDVLGHYFRHLYQILDHIDRFTINGARAPYRLRKRYAKILRAQLSSHELSALLINCTGSMVDKGSFKEKVVRYRLLEHLPIYVHEDAELRAPGIDGGSNDIFFEYFSLAIKPRQRWKPGAFGKNIRIREYLASQSSLS